LAVQRKEAFRDKTLKAVSIKLTQIPGSYPRTELCFYSTSQQLSAVYNDDEAIAIQRFLERPVVVDFGGRVGPQQIQLSAQALAQMEIEVMVFARVSRKRYPLAWSTSWMLCTADWLFSQSLLRPGEGARQSFAQYVYSFAGSIERSGLLEPQIDSINQKLEAGETQMCSPWSWNN
jgi:hypothetical protein